MYGWIYLNLNMREYIVTLKQGVDYDRFYDEMIHDHNLYPCFCSNLECIPTRSVEIADDNILSLRNTNYFLTDEESETLKNDQRVKNVVSLDDINKHKISFRTTQYGNFNSNENSIFSSSINYGLIQHKFYDYPFTNGGNSNTGYFSNTNESFTYVLDGKNVDVIITDSGVESTHPEFLDDNGNSRVLNFDWYANAKINPPRNNINNLVDTYGHGTACASVITGKKYGWAKKANIYSIKLHTLKGPGDVTGGVDTSDVFNLIKHFHVSKSINTETGRKNPTIINASWGQIKNITFFPGVMTAKYITPYILSGSYRSTLWTVTNPPLYSDAYWTAGNLSYTASSVISPGGSSDFESFRTQLISKGLFNKNLLPYTGGETMPAVVDSTNADLEDCIDSGVHVCIAAGNDRFKIDIAGGVDYNNYCYHIDHSPSLKFYYHRGGSPYSTSSIVVGALDAPSYYVSRIVYYPSTLTKRVQADYSQFGPGVDLYAAGSQIVMATSTTNAFYYTDSYEWNKNYKCVRSNGTSFASPQVCGLAATILQKYPHFTPNELKNYIISSSIKDQMYTSSMNSNDYSVDYSIAGGNPYILYNKYYNDSSNLKISGQTFKIKTGLNII